MRSLRSSIKGSGCRKPCRYKSFKSVVKNPLSSHCVTLKSKSRVGQSCPTLCDPWTGACQASLSMEFSRQEYWSGLAFFLQEIFSTQGLNPILLYCRQILYHLSHQGSPCKIASFSNRLSLIKQGHISGKIPKICQANDFHFFLDYFPILECPLPLKRAISTKKGNRWSGYL